MPDIPAVSGTKALTTGVKRAIAIDLPPWRAKNSSERLIALAACRT